MAGVDLNCRVRVDLTLEINGRSQTSSNYSYTASQSIRPNIPALNPPVINGNRVRLFWTLDGTASIIEIHKKVGTSGQWQLLRSVQGREREHTYTEYTSGTHFYKVRARTMSEISNFSNEVSAVIEGSSGPEPPPPSGQLIPPILTLARGISPTEVSLEWDDLSDNENGFEIWRKRFLSSGDFSIVTRTGENIETFRDTGLAMREQYSYKIRAFIIGDSGLRFSEFSNVRTAVTLMPPIFIPTQPDPTPLPSPPPKKPGGSREKPNPMCYISTVILGFNQNSLQLFRNYFLTLNAVGYIGNSAYLRLSPLCARLLSSYSSTIAIINFWYATLLISGLMLFLFCRTKNSQL
jgi:hypothetical protein